MADYSTERRSLAAKKGWQNRNYKTYHENVGFSWASAAAKSGMEEEQGDQERESGSPIATSINRYLAGDETGFLVYEPTRGISPEMGWHPTNRTQKAVYDPNNQVVFVTFRNGIDVYAYEDITMNEWRSLRARNSVGQWVNQVGNHHNYYQIEG